MLMSDNNYSGIDSYLPLALLDCVVVFVITEFLT